MKIFYNNTFIGHWPAGTAAIVIAETRTKAARILETELAILELKQKIKAENMIEIKMEEGNCVILNDGDY